MYARRTAEGDAKKPRIILAHDYLSQKGGAERVVLELAKILNPAEIVTSFYEPDATFSELKQYLVKTGFFNFFGILRRDPRRALPLLPFSWSWRRAIDADLVICSSSGWAHGVRTTATTRKVVYCHNPPRWLYQTDDYIMNQAWYVKYILRFLRPLLLIWDRRAAASADLYIANSTSVARRIFAVYGREAKVIFPPLSLNEEIEMEPVQNIGAGYFLAVGRERGYKGMKLLRDAFNRMPDQRLVVVGGSRAVSSNNIIDTGYVSDRQLKWLYKHARALISVSHEDFGLTPIEANSNGTPVLLLRAGGFIDTTDEGVSGKFIENESLDCIISSVRNYPSLWDKELIVRHARKFSREAFCSSINEIINGGELA